MTHVQTIQVVWYNSLVVARQNVANHVNAYWFYTGVMKRFWCRPFADWLKRNDTENLFRVKQLDYVEGLLKRNFDILSFRRNDKKFDVKNENHRKSLKMFMN